MKKLHLIIFILSLLYFKLLNLTRSQTNFCRVRDMSKRQAESEPGGTEPPAKKIVFEPLQLGAINNIEELDIKTLQFQNRKLGQRLGLKNKIEEELRAR